MVFVYRSIFYVFSLILLLGSCNGRIQGEDDGPEQWIILDKGGTMSFDSGGGIQNINFSIGKSALGKELKTVVSPEGEDWITSSIAGTTMTVLVEANFTQQARYSTIIAGFDEKHKVEISIQQDAVEETEDHLIKIIRGYPSDGMDNDHLIGASWDGDKMTYFNSPTGAVSYPYVIEYEFEPGHTLNKIIYTPRTDSGNKWGSFDEFSIEVCTENDGDSFRTIGSYARGEGVHTPLSVVGLEEKDIRKARFVITKSYMDRVSCAEMEFVEVAKNGFRTESIFEDLACTKLKAGITRKQILQIPSATLRGAALEMLDGCYDTDWRIAAYRPWQKPELMASENKTSKYSLTDNPTGIYAVPGEKLTVAVGPIYRGGEISMMVQNLSDGYGSYKTYSLNEGLNEIIAETGGLIYILNHTNDNLPLFCEGMSEEQSSIIDEKTVMVHFVGGRQQGYFDITRHSQQDWEKILGSASYKDIDVLGRYAHVTWKAEDYRSFGTDILRMVADMDSLVRYEWDFIGLEKYDCAFRNRIHAAIDYKASSPNASDYRTVYTPGYANAFCSHDSFLKRLWVQSHEIGHINQVRPGMKWAGMTEVTNNLYCLYVQTKFGVKCKLMADGISGSNVATDRNWYVNARDSIIVAKRPHCLPNSGKNINRELQLVPFWQLKLYLVDALGQKDFYRDLFEHYRRAADLNTALDTEGILQLEFVRQVCRLSGVNLTDFFEKWGFLTPVDTVLNDYSQKPFRITEEQISQLKDEIAQCGYVVPVKDVCGINDENIDSYK